MLKAIIFDANGILYEHPPYEYETRYNIFLRLGCKKSYEDFLVVWNKYKQSYRDEVLSAKDRIFRTVKELGMAPADTLYNQVMEGLVELGKNAVLVPGVIDVLTNLKKRRLKLAVLSSSSKRGFKEDKLKSLGIAKFFDKIFGTFDVGYTKHDKRAYLKVLSDLNVKPSETAFVGHREYEIKGAKSAGLVTISLTEGMGEDYFIKSLQELPKLISSFTKQ